MSDKKVGIVTLQGEDNFGNVLQNFAVQTIIESLGYKAFTLNNKTLCGFPIPIYAYVSIWSKLRFKYIVYYLKEKIGIQSVGDLSPLRLAKSLKELKKINKLENLRHKKFEKNKKENNHYINLSIEAAMYAKEEFEDYYAFITGSDQVWNPNFSTVSGVNFLRFAPEHKRIAFAASFGVDQIPKRRTKIYSKWMKEIPSISVREKVGVKIVKMLTNCEAAHLLDPTFSVTKEQWEQYAKKPDYKLDKKQYVLIYFLGDKTREYNSWIREYAEKNRLLLVSVHDIHMPEFFCADPSEFVWLIANAAVVFTDSFHGMALSINLNIPFLVFERKEIGKSMSSRIESVLSGFGLEQYLYHKKYIYEDVLKINYEKVNGKIKDERARTLSWIGEALEKVEKAEKYPLTASDNHCTGCGACYNVCPFGAISMEVDSEGFKYPVINKKKCLKCMRCEDVCPQDRKREEKLPLGAYFAIAKDKEILKKSSSGGVFYYLSKRILDKGGAVFGVRLNECFDAIHSEVRGIADLDSFLTSKYIQSNTNNSFVRVKHLLDDGRTVLYSGTPCQIAGLKKFLGTDYEHLLTVDFLCHGVPSPEIWNIYKKERQKQNIKLKDVNFRNKIKGWRNYALSMLFEDGSEYFGTFEQDPYLRAFLGNLSLRPSCYSCQYRNHNRKSDITLADFWGASAVLPEKENEMGMSMVLIQTEKGKKFFAEAACGVMDYGDIDVIEALKYNEAASLDPPYTMKREKFFEGVEAGKTIGHSVSKLLWRDNIKFGIEHVLVFIFKIKRRL